MTDGQPVADVEGDRDSFRAVARHQAPGQARVGEDGRPDHRARGARPQRALDSALVSQAPGDLDAGPLPHPGHDGGDHLELARCRIAGSIEVHDVQPARAGVGEAHGNLDRVVPVDRLPVEVAPQEPHDAAAPQVDGGQQVEGRRGGLARCHGTMIAW